MTDLATHDDRPARITGKPKPGKPQTNVALVSSYKLAAHLGCSRQFIDSLVAQGVLSREPGGFNQDRARLQYIAHLKAARRSSAHSEADAAFTSAKTRMMQLKIAKAEGDLMQTDDAMDVIERMVGMFRTGLGSLPAQIGGHDLQMRRRVERFCHDILDGISKEAIRQAEKLERELGIDPDDYPA